MGDTVKMMDGEFLQAKKVKELRKEMVEQWGTAFGDGYHFFKTGKDKIFIVSKGVQKIDLQKLKKIDRIGLYVAEWKNDQLRLSVEGAQLIGPDAAKNIVGLTKEQVKEYFKGNDIEIALPFQDNPFVLLRYGTDFLGCAKYKEGRLLNFLPKVHRTKELIL